ncbi:5-(carboxyamino)imidazole ribonucleotide synthase [Actinomycetaceae bacterium L2_0104]
MSIQHVVGTGAEQAAPTVGVIGGGQLARMMQESAVALGIQLHALVEAADGSSGQVIPRSQVGGAQDAELIFQLAEGVDVLTVEHEHVPDAILERVSRSIPVRPGAHALRYAQDKLAMRAKMDELGIPGPRWFAVHSDEDIAAALQELGGEAIAKTPRDGYDGKGVRVIRDAADVADWLESTGEEGLLIEEKIPFASEAAQLVSRRPQGEMRSWPVVETVQELGTCFEVVAPAPNVDGALAERIREIGERVAQALDVVGILAVELFLAPDDAGALKPYVNELAMRPHNSGHWTIEGAQTSQFEQHLRAVLDLPLGSVEQLAPWAVMVNVLGSSLHDPREAYPRVMAAYPEAKIHMYGKAVAPRRKIGHVTVLGDDLEQVRHVAHEAAAMLRGEK